MVRPVLRVSVAIALSLGLLSTEVPASAATKIGLGDSVMQGATTELRARGFRVNTVQSRQFSAAPALIRSLRAAGRLPPIVVIHLGNNGYIEQADCRAAVRAAQNRRVYLVTLKVPRGWRAANNRRLRICANRFASASVVDWFSYAVNHPSWFYDGFHLTPIGRRKYASFIASQT
ncbi:MAG: hypothetical protein ACXWZU_10380 [Actinomycetota bacterium]